jgi:hypothetical protein
LDQPVLNFSKNYEKNCKIMQCDYIFDEIRIPIASDSDISHAVWLLEDIINGEDAEYLKQAKEAFQNNYPSFLREAESDRHVLIHVDEDRIWLKGKFVTPYGYRNELRTKMYLRFIEHIKNDASIKLA